MSAPLQSQADAKADQDQAGHALQRLADVGSGPGLAGPADQVAVDVQPAEQDAFVQKIVEAGEYQNASEAIRDALRVLQQRRREDGLKLKVLRAQIKAGTDALERGDFTEVDDTDLERYLERLTTLAPKHAR